ncbi:MAG: adenylate/guanylate cyclase domain-containing protein [Candidatus Berkelbacteria bacterium]
MTEQKESELEIIKKTDFIIDSNQELSFKSEKVLQFLLKELGVSTGAIIFHDPFQNNLNILAAKGSANNKVIDLAFRKKQTIELGMEIAVPISIRQKVFGVIYLSGKIFDNNDRDLIQSAEVILDGTFSEELKTSGLQSLFEKYVDEKIINKMIDHPDKSHMSGERHNCSILFADLSGFTKYSNSHVPETTIALLNFFYGKMSEIVLKHGGTVDKFIGDEIMAVYGSPLPQKDHAVSAIKSAIEMQKSAKYIIEKFNIPDGGLCIGIATGVVIAGDVGSEKMKDYTVIGSKVNLAARLTSAAPKNSIIVDLETKNDAPDFKYLPSDLEEIRGFAQKVSTYKVAE